MSIYIFKAGDKPKLCFQWKRDTKIDNYTFNKLKGKLTSTLSLALRLEGILHFFHLLAVIIYIEGMILIILYMYRVFQKKRM